MTRQHEVSLTFHKGPLDGRTRNPDSVIVDMARPEYFYTEREKGVSHEYVVDWETARADYVTSTLVTPTH